MGGAGPTHFLREKPWGRGWRIMNSHKTTVTAFCFYLLIWQSIASSTRKCSRLLDSGEEAKVKNAWKVGGAGKRKKEGRQSFRPPPPALPSFLMLYFRVCAFSIQRTQLSRCLEQANTQRKRPYLFLDLPLSNHSCCKSSNRNLFSLKLYAHFFAKIFFIKACNLCILTYLKLISRYLGQLPASLRKQTASLRNSLASQLTKGSPSVWRFIPF